MDQYYIDYGSSEESWREQAIEWVKNEDGKGMNTYSIETQHAFTSVLDWLQQWACARSYGLGTKLPFDESFLVEGLRYVDVSKTIVDRRDQDCSVRMDCPYRSSSQRFDNLHGVSDRFLGLQIHTPTIDELQLLYHRPLPAQGPLRTRKVSGCTRDTVSLQVENPTMPR